MRGIIIFMCGDGGGAVGGGGGWRCGGVGGGAGGCGDVGSREKVWGWGE